MFSVLPKILEPHLGLIRLRELGRAKPCAIMCAEAVWWRCHRRIIADHLIAAGERVFHILGPKAVTPASLTKGVTPRPDGADLSGSSGENERRIDVTSLTV
jgi:hypothetical protein